MYTCQAETFSPRDLRQWFTEKRSLSSSRLGRSDVAEDLSESELVNRSASLSYRRWTTCHNSLHSLLFHEAFRLCATYYSFWQICHCINSSNHTSCMASPIRNHKRERIANSSPNQLKSSIFGNLKPTRNQNCYIKDFNFFDTSHNVLCRQSTLRRSAGISPSRWLTLRKLSLSYRES